MPLSMFTHTCPEDLAPAICESEAAPVGAGFVFFGAVAIAGPDDDPPEDEPPAGAELAILFDGVEAGAGALA